MPQAPVQSSIVAAYHDAAATLSFAQAQAAARAGRFHLLQGRFHPGYSAGAWWLRVRFAPSGSAGADWLYLKLHDVADLRAWVPEAEAADTAGWRSFHIAKGLPLPQAARPTGRGLALPVAGLTGAPVIVWLRFSGPRPLYMDALELLSSERMAAVLRSATAQLTAKLVVVGVLLLAAIVTAYLLPGWLYLAFALQLVGTLLFIVEEWYPVLAWLGDGHRAVAAAWVNAGDAFVTFTTLFMGYALLDLRRTTPRLARGMRGLLIAAIIVGVVGVALGASGVISRWQVAVTLAANALFIAIAAWSFWRRKPLALWPFVAYGVGGGGTILYQTGLLGWVDVSGVGRVLLGVAPVVFLLAVCIMLGMHAKRRARAAEQVLVQAAVDARDSNERTQALVTERTVQLNEALKAQRSLLDVVSHDFRTPLAVIDSSAQLLRDLGGDAVDARELGKIRNATRRMVHLVDDILADSRVDMSTAQPGFATCRLGTLAQELCVQQAELIGRNYRCVVDPDDPCVRADQGLLRVVVTNLLDNAAKYSPAEQAVEVTVARSGEMAVLRVRDHGQGIEAADLPHLFERYYRAPSVSKRSGLGFGLYIAQRIVQRYDGSLTAANAQGGGAVFELCLPCVV